MVRTFAAVAATAACSIALGCATPVPQSKVNSSAAAIQSAEQLGAVDDPRAAQHLQMARDQRNRGLSLINAGKNKEAGRMLDRAQADAELAYSLAGEANMRNEAARMLEEILFLRAKL